MTPSTKSRVVACFAAMLLALGSAGPAFSQANELENESTPVSPTIRLLAEQVATRGPEAVEDFWLLAEVRGGPLVEPSGTRGRNFVTFFQRQEHPSDRFRLESGITVLLTTTVADHERALGEFQRLGVTDVAYLTMELPSDLRAPYAIRRQRAGEETWERVLDRWNPTVFAESTRWARSVIDLPSAPKTPWDGFAPEGTWTEMPVTSRALGGNRTVLVYLPPTYEPGNADPYPVLLGMDSFGFRSPLMPVDQVLAYLESQRSIPATVMLLTEDVGPNGDEAGYDGVVRFLVDEVLATARTHYNISTGPSDVVLAGMSRRGMIAAYAALRRPDAIGKVLSLSGSYYWRTPGLDEFEVIPRLYAEAGATPTRFYLSAGLLETFLSVRNGGHALLATNRHMRNVLTAKGYSFQYHEFMGVHSEVNWIVELARGLEWLWRS